MGLIKVLRGTNWVRKREKDIRERMEKKKKGKRRKEEGKVRKEKGIKCQLANIY